MQDVVVKDRKRQHSLHARIVIRDVDEMQVVCVRSFASRSFLVPVITCGVDPPISVDLCHAVPFMSGCLHDPQLL